MSGGGRPWPDEEGVDCEAGSEREGRQTLPGTSKIVSSQRAGYGLKLAKSSIASRAAELHARARCEATEHDLLCQNIQHVVLHGYLEITWSWRKVARDNCKDVI